MDGSEVVLLRDGVPMEENGPVKEPEPNLDPVHQSDPEMIGFSNESDSDAFPPGPWGEVTPVDTDIEGQEGTSPKVRTPRAPSAKKKQLVKKGLLKPRKLDFASEETNKSKNPSRGRPNRISKREKLLRIQGKRIADTDGTWVQCCNNECNKWRYLQEIQDPCTVPIKWYCKMNTDDAHNSCDKEEADYSQLQFIFVKHTAGSIVWAKLSGYPWWPAMVDDDPDTRDYFWTNGFSEIPTHYHVVFLDCNVTRAWISSACVKAFARHRHAQDNETKKLRRSLQVQLHGAVKKAQNAMAMPIPERLKVLSFANTYKGKWLDSSETSFESDNEQARHPQSSEMQKEPEEGRCFYSSDGSADDSSDGCQSIKRTENNLEQERKKPKLATLKTKKSFGIKRRNLEKNPLLGIDVQAAGDSNYIPASSNPTVEPILDGNYAEGGVKTVGTEEVMEVDKPTAEHQNPLDPICIESKGTKATLLDICIEDVVNGMETPAVDFPPSSGVKPNIEPLAPTVGVKAKIKKQPKIVQITMNLGSVEASIEDVVKGDFASSIYTAEMSVPENNQPVNNKLKTLEFNSTATEKPKKAPKIKSVKAPEEKRESNISAARPKTITLKKPSSKINNAIPSKPDNANQALKTKPQFSVKKKSSTDKENNVSVKGDVASKKKKPSFKAPIPKSQVDHFDGFPMEKVAAEKMEAQLNDSQSIFGSQSLNLTQDTDDFESLSQLIQELSPPSSQKSNLFDLEE